MHVADGVDENQRSHHGDDKEHHRAQRIDRVADRQGSIAQRRPDHAGLVAPAEHDLPQDHQREETRQRERADGHVRPFPWQPPAPEDDQPEGEEWQERD